LNRKIQKKILVLIKDLESRYGRPNNDRNFELLDVLIETLLSQSTTDHNRDLAFTNLKKTFPDWELVNKASEKKVSMAIRSAGLGNQKAKRIKSFLKFLKRDYGILSLEFLKKKDTQFCVDFLTKHKGIGIKTAYVSLMLAANRDVFPIDVHIHRIMQRLTIILKKTTAEKSHSILAPYIPKLRAHEFHMNLLTFGRNICKSQNPKCGECNFNKICSYFLEKK